MNPKHIHTTAGIIITIFISLHLCNHVYSLWGANEHIEMMKSLRMIYRNVLAEIILLSAVLVQIVSGIHLFIAGRRTKVSFFHTLQRAAGLYLAFFFIIHISAVLIGRLILNLDTNFYFGVAGLNTFPINLFFIPYYGLAIIAFFSHIAAIHSKKMKRTILGITPRAQSIAIIILGVSITFIIFCGLTNYFHGVTIPKEYQILTGK